MAYPSDNLADVLTALGTDAGTASSSLATISAGSDVLTTNFAGLKALVDDLSSLASVLKNQAFYTPVGSIMPFAGASSEVPAGWLLCAGVGGTTVTSAAYPDLFNVLTAGGTVYPHGGSGSTTYTPDLRGRTIIGVGAGAEITGVLGTLQGVANVTLTSAQSGVPVHLHSVTNFNTTDGAGSHNHTYSKAVSAGNAGSTSNGTLGSLNLANTGDAGGHNHNIPNHNTNNNTAADAAAAHTNIQPSIPLNYIIKV